MKIVMLDFDGVIITHRALYAYNDRFFTNREHGGFKDLDPVACNFLRRMCKYRDVRIVVSSTWRVHQDKCWDRLKAAGLLEYLYLPDWRTIQSGGNRGSQIKEWLDRHPEVEDYRIIDDDSDMLPEQMEKFIKCHGYEGLGMEGMQKLVDWTEARKKS